MWRTPAVVIALLGVTSTYSQICKTDTETTPVKDATPDTPCAFPFVYNNRTWNGCKRDRKGEYWCSTKVDPATRKHVKDNWGYCNPDCDSSCRVDETCELLEDCPPVNAIYEKFQSLEKKTPEKIAFGKKLKRLICHKEEPSKFCCSLKQQNLVPISVPIVESTTENNTPKKTSYPPSCQTEPTSNFLGNILPRSGSCGLSCNTDARVVKGEDAKLGEFPWAALLGYESTRQEFDFRKNDWVKRPYVAYKCGGTLINTWYVVTAAHCHGERKGRSVYQVVLGEWEVSEIALQNKDPDCTPGGKQCMPKVQKIPVDTVIVHDEYTKSRKGVFRDIALIRLGREAVLNRAVQMACLPVDTLIMASELQIAGFGNGLGDYDSWVIGWGHTENFDEGELEESGVAKALLQKAKLPLWTVEGCQKKWPRGFISEDLLCAGAGADGADSCKGDSGGGLFIKKNTTVKIDRQLYGYVQVGLVSYGSTTCGDGSPGVYTRLSEYMDWIRENILP